MTQIEKTTKTAYDYGFETGKHDAGEGVYTKAKIDNTEIPLCDYQSIRAAGVEPDAREYWRGYNDALDI